MKGSAITGPVGKEAADLWPVSTPRSPLRMDRFADGWIAYRLELRRGDVKKYLFISFVAHNFRWFFFLQVIIQKTRNCLASKDTRSPCCATWGMGDCEEGTEAVPHRGLYVLPTYNATLCRSSSLAPHHGTHSACILVFPPRQKTHRLRP